MATIHLDGGVRSTGNGSVASGKDPYCYLAVNRGWSWQAARPKDILKCLKLPGVPGRNGHLSRSIGVV